jgi:uncharacterized membrane protein (TIGR02234 family)
MRERGAFAAALVLTVLGGAGALLCSTRHWQSAVLPRQRPLADDVLQLTGRTVDAAPTAFALVALAGVVAVLATRGLPRRLVGAVLAVTGAVLAWRSLAALRPLGADRVRTLDAATHSGVGVDASVLPHVTVHPLWPWLSAIGGVLVAVAGLLVAARGHAWAGLSGRYETARAEPAAHTAHPAQTEHTAPQPGDVALWNALDRGDDPTAPGAG